MEVSVRVNFNAGTEDDLTTFPNLLLAAVPTKPSYMASRMLGACIVPSRSEGFHVETYFERTAGEADIEDYAAFTYVISMMGEPPEGGTMRLMWKSAYLTLMEHNELAGQVQKIENSTDGFDRYIDIPQEAIALYEHATKEEALALAVDLSCRLARDIRPLVDGYYVITPAGRPSVAAKIIQAIRAWEARD